MAAQLRALWCVLDADDTDAVEVDEFAAFLRGHIDNLLDEKRKRKPPPPGILNRPNVIRMRKKKPERPP